MSENCNHACNTCDKNCNERKTSFQVAQNEASHIKKVIGIVSGKGGVGKSMVTSLLAIAANRSGIKSGILDGDITGPSIPKMFGIHGKAESDGTYLYPMNSDAGIPVMSMNLILNEETDPVIWRGPVIAGAVKQFWTDVAWGDVDCLFVDMPPGTGDVPLTVFQSLPVDGIVIVTSPQELVSMIVEKAVVMAEKMEIPILGIVENMAYFQCDECGKRHDIFGKSQLEALANKHNIPNTARLPIEPSIVAHADAEHLECIEGDFLKDVQELAKNVIGIPR